jgi:hypothetical protein
MTIFLTYKAIIAGSGEQVWQYECAAFIRRPDDYLTNLLIKNMSQKTIQ